VTGYGLDDPGIESLWGREFPHVSCPGANSASFTVGTGSLPWVKAAGGVGLTPPPPIWSAEFLEMVELYLYSILRAFVVYKMCETYCT